jgi:drug/metabolite transporter (DMT)-like permease
MKGPLIVLGAPLAFALYNVLLRPLLGRYDLLALTAATSLVGMIGLVPLADRSTLDTVGNLSSGDVLRLLYLGIVATFLGYIAWNVGLRGLGPTRAVTYTYAISPVAVLTGALVLDEPVTVWLAVGGVLAIGGIALAQRGPRSARRAPSAAPLRAPGR